MAQSLVSAIAGGAPARTINELIERAAADNINALVTHEDRPTTAMHAAAEVRCKDLLERLLMLGGDPNLRVSNVDRDQAAWNTYTWVYVVFAYGQRTMPDRLAGHFQILADTQFHLQPDWPQHLLRVLCQRCMLQHSWETYIALSLP